MKLNIGCGRDIREGWVNLDINKTSGVDVVHNLNEFPYPFKENSLDEVLAIDVFEHVDDLILVLEELFRICKPGATIKAVVPYGVGWVEHIQHKRGFNYTTFKSVSQNKREVNYFTKADIRQIDLKTKPTKVGRFIPNFWVPKSELRFREIVSTFLNNIVKEMYVTLEVVKEK